MRAGRATAGAVALWLALSVWAADSSSPAVTDPALEHRLMVLSAELRCLVCQNQSLADSHADLAIDLKNQVREMMRAGRSDEQIKAYLTQRYGDFVLYNPPVKATTWMLWLGPFAALLAGSAALVLYLRRRRVAVAVASPDLSAADSERARRLLDGDAAPPA